MSTAAPPRRLCSVIAKAQGDKPLGTAWAVRRMLAMELELPWPEDFFAARAFPVGMGEKLAALWAEHPETGILAFAPDRVNTVPGMTRIIDFRYPEPPHAAATREDEPRPAPSVTPGPRWSTEGMDQLPRAVRTRFVRRLCRAGGCPEDALSAHVLASIDEALLHPGPRRAWDLHPRSRLHLAEGWLWLEPCGAATRAANH